LGTATEHIYSFSNGPADKDLLGNKGANLLSMTQQGLPVPPGFVLTIDAYKLYKKSGELPHQKIEQSVIMLEEQTGRRLGDGLRVSVRSSAPVSMPGMMDTLLNVGTLEKTNLAVKQVFESWDTPRAIEYRRINRIPPDLGTAAIVQAMVYGNRDSNSGTGVVFTRNPSTGEKGLCGEYLAQAQGEELVSGARTPEPVAVLKSQMPKAYAELDRLSRSLEVYYRDMQDVEFTIESGKLYILQTRSGKRSGQAAVRIAVDMVKENTITPQEAIERVTFNNIQALLHRQIQSPEKYVPIAKGLGAAPGATSGKVVFDVLEAMSIHKKGEPVILVRLETSPDDIQGIVASDGILTVRGGLTSHAAIVTRAMGKPCVCGAGDINIDPSAESFRVKGQVIEKGSEITIDGTTGNVYLGVLPLEDVKLIEDLQILTGWASGFKHLAVLANADTPEMVAQAIKFGAEGIGLCRTERMFNEPERLALIREFILGDSAADKTEALEKLGEMQKQDFIAIFGELQGIPIIVRLLDMPLHEFLPREEETQDTWLRRRIEELKEINPMLGHRGVRLAVTNPELYQMQIKAIERARAEVPEADVSIMIPQVITSQEVLLVRGMLRDPSIKLGVMMETVRACMRAGKIAHCVDFMSFGTNDLTQAVYSFSREDAEKKFLTTYLEAGVLVDNPFQIIDIKGVGQLMQTAIFWARRANRNIRISVCGEQAGEPRSIRFFQGIGIDSVSCSPFRLQATKLVAAQAAIKAKSEAEREFSATRQ
jgi:pyruvate,orthophosphate dikinase